MANELQFTAPGVFTGENRALLRPIAGVETGVPVFIGYTQFARQDGRPAFFELVRIASLLEYEAAFGGRHMPAYRLAPGSATDHDVVAQRWDAAARRFEPAYVSIPRARPTDPANAARPARFNLHDSIRLFYANGGGPCYVVSVGDYTGARRGAAAIEVAALQKGLDVAGRTTGPTMLVVPDAVQLAPTGSQNGMPVSSDFATLISAMLEQCGRLQDRVAVLDVYAADALDPAHVDAQSRLDAVVDNFRDSVGDSALDFGMAYFPFLATSVVGEADIDYTCFDTADLRAILTDQAAFAHPDAAAAGPAANRNPDFLRLKVLIDAMASTADHSTQAGRAAIAALNRDLVAALPLLAQMEAVVQADLALLPPSGALAGVCAQNDMVRGVWHAPANIGLKEVIAPNINLTDAQQGPLNVPTQGKAIDAVRFFDGRGTLVWGARTLDATYLEPRYIQVRRTLIYIEQSLRVALDAFVFESNDAKTWDAVRLAVTSFLQDLWRAGGLFGAKAEDAFMVRCGLGATMAAADIEAGRLFVEVAVALVNPAEFVPLSLTPRPA
jgi:Bacteriophage tail sheath protein